MVRVNSIRPLTFCYRARTINNAMSPNEVRLEKLKTEIKKFPSVSAFAREYNQDENYIRQLLKGRRPFGERAARKMGEEHFGSPDYFSPMLGSQPADPPAPKLPDKDRELLEALAEIEAALPGKAALLRAQIIAEREELQRQASHAKQAAA